MKRKPFDDPRVRRALHLAFDRPALIDVVKDVTPMRVGGFIYPFSEFATPPEELSKRVGYQPDTGAALKEARALMAAAGHADGLEGLDFLVRDVASFKLWAQAIQAMLQEGLNVTMSKGITHTIISASTTLFGRIRSGWTRRELSWVAAALTIAIAPPK